MSKGEPYEKEPALQDSILYIKVGNDIYTAEDLRTEKEKDEEE
jgi:hypothetical protein